MPATAADTCARQTKIKNDTNCRHTWPFARVCGGARNLKRSDDDLPEIQLSTTWAGHVATRLASVKAPRL